MSSSPRPLPAFEDRAPADRYCDLILTGGVTSAVAYPGAIVALATAYRFHRIGGSSSGAGAAALAAAAEYRRRRGSSAGFRLLIERMREIEAEVDAKTGLAWLFQPSPSGRRLFEALVPTVAAGDGRRRWWLWSLIQAYGLNLLMGGLAGVLLVCIRYSVVRTGMGLSPWDPVDPFADAAAYLAAHTGTSVFVVLAAAAWGAWLAFSNDLASLVDADYGLCSGLASEPNLRKQPLTPWLHGLIQELAGRGPKDDPLTFADLVGAPGSPRETSGDPAPAGAVSIGLQMFTANITHGRPYLLPQEDEAGDTALGRFSVDGPDLDAQGDPRLYFRPAEMRRLFPDDVVNHMIAKGGLVEPQPGTRDVGIEEPVRLSRRAAGSPIAQWARRPGCPRAGADAGSAVSPTELAFHRLPRQHLPLVVAARMSVSFPVLFSAVPLWVADYSDRGDTHTVVFRRCLFSDGGLCSNFPIHLFDSPIPAWPTFGISLHDASVTPRRTASKPWNADGQARRDAIRTALRPLQTQTVPGPELWRREPAGASSIGLLSGVAAQLLATMKNWNDKTLARLPGVRDRVVEVELDPRLGGLNILMTSAQIGYLADLGTEAGRRLLERFASPAGPSGVADGWREHRWIRFNVLRDCLARALSGLSASASGARYATPMHEQIREAANAPPLKDAGDSQLLASQAAALEGILATLMQAERDLAAASAEQPCKPVPRPDLRVRPPL